MALGALRLLVFGPDARDPVDTFDMAGHTLADALRWLGTAVARREGAPLRELVRPAHEMPPHPVSDGAHFAVEVESFREIDRWYANAARLLAPTAGLPGASPVRCWPHHFDIATLVSLDAGGGEHARSIGVGLSPGDASYAEPYFYVTPWPYPEKKDQPALPVGAWHETGWFGAVLTASQLVSHAGDAQPRAARSFVDAAFDQCRSILRR